MGWGTHVKSYPHGMRMSMEEYGPCWTMMGGLQVGVISQCTLQDLEYVGKNALYGFGWIVLDKEKAPVKRRLNL